MALTLKLLNGSMQGRSLRLPQGKLTMGLGDVDIQVAFDNGATLVSLDVVENEVRLLDKTPCWVEGRSLNGSLLPTHKIIDLAGQAFILLDEGETFMPRRIPERLAKGRWRLSRLQKRIVAGVILIAALAGVGMGGYLWQHQETESEKVERLGIQRWLNQQHQTPALRTLGFEWLRDGTLRVYGQCLQQSALDNVLHILRARGVFWRLETRCQDGLVEDVQFLLDQYGYKDIDVGNGKYPGEIRISGDIQADSHWQQVTQQLMLMDGLKSWSVVPRGTAGGRALLAAVRDSGLLGKVTISKEGNHLIISGKLTTTQKQVLENRLKTLREGDKLTLVFQHIDPLSLGDENVFPSAVVSVGGSKSSPYLILADGRRLQAGALLQNGYEIAKIDPQSGVDIYRDGQLLHMSIAL